MNLDNDSQLRDLQSNKCFVIYIYITLHLFQVLFIISGDVHIKGKGSHSVTLIEKEGDAIDEHLCIEKILEIVINTNYIPNIFINVVIINQLIWVHVSCH